ncbi:MAG: 50S ribosomal protein L6 [Promethearchaeota archaeon]|nr:MAG: 50S ribosomal protein L6 [Candidatus Lokiarchaeota archaeon]
MVKQALFLEQIDIPKEVSITLGKNHYIEIQGPNGKVAKDFSHIRGIKISKENNKLIFKAHFPRGTTVALANTIINIVQNVIKGVTTNYQYISKVCYSHFPCSVEADPQKREIRVVNFLGERAPRTIKYDPNELNVEIKGEDVHFIGPDKEKLGQTAANLKRVCRIRKKDPRIYQDGVYLYKILHGDELIWEIK